MNTGRSDPWKSDLKLRHNQVRFVSAEQTAEPDATDGMDEADNNSEQGSPSRQSPTAEDAWVSEDEDKEDTARADTQESQVPEVSIEVNTQSNEPALDPTPEPSFVIDTRGTEVVGAKKLKDPVIRQRSPSNSDSSGDEVVFSGRGKGIWGKTPSPKIVEDPVIPASSRPTPSSAAVPVALKATGEERKPRRKRRIPNRRNNDDELIADYIANMDMAWDEASDTEGKSVQPMDGGIITDAQEIHHGMEWSSDDLQDFDDLGTSVGVLEKVDQVLSKRERPSGLQYLVVWDGQDIDEARWILAPSLTMAGAAEAITDFEKNEETIREYMAADESSTDTSADGENDSYDSLSGDQDDEDDLIERRIERMSDEQIARMLAKQEELGLGSGEVVLFNGDDGFDEEEDEDELGMLADVSLSDGLFTKPKKSKSKSKSKSGFPSGTAFADALDEDPYHGFDVMDFERPSLRKKPKGRRQPLELGLSDEELEQNLQSAWDNDRRKKSSKKAEREALRAQGLLGKNGKIGKIDMKAKYKEGITVDEVKAEIKTFLISGHESLPLPPMDKGDRYQVHIIANVFNLKSKSVGSGLGRSPVLYKTSRTEFYDEQDEQVIDGLLANKKRFFGRMDKKGKKGSKAPQGLKKSRGGASGPGATYREGEVVGAAAPELGIENRGRAMLEKMGWSTGTALGALNNKGILQPVPHVVKNTKAGLG